jgi:hypothetical protein
VFELYERIAKTFETCRYRRLDLYSIKAILPQCHARSGSLFLTWRNPDLLTVGEREAIETLNIPKD